MADEEQTQPESGWFDKLQDAESLRNYRPVRGPEEPSQPPSGRASASVQPGDAAPSGGEDAGDSASITDQGG